MNNALSETPNMRTLGSKNGFIFLKNTSWGYNRNVCADYRTE